MATFATREPRAPAAAAPARTLLERTPPAIRPRWALGGQLGHALSAVRIHPEARPEIQRKAWSDAARPTPDRDGLLLGEPGDALEREADAAADAVTAGRPIQIKLGRSASGAAIADPALAGRLRGLEGQGEPIAPVARSRLETRFGVDFGRVRIHAAGPAAALAPELGARAFTLGDHIVFAPGQYAPGTAAGDRLVAHELAHVVQQAGGGEAAGARSNARGVVQRNGVGEWWEKNVSERYAALKEDAYKALIDSARFAQKKAVAGLRAAAAALPESLQGPADILIDTIDETLEVLMGVVYAVVGIAVGFGEGVVDIVKGLIQLIYTVLDLLVRFVAGFFGARYRRAFDERANEILAAVKEMPAGLKRLVDDWLERFKKASTERQQLMIGELTGQILAFIATFEVAATKAGQLPKLQIPMVVTRGDQLAVAVATVDVGAPVAAGVMAGTATMMTMGGGEKEPPKPATTDEPAEPAKAVEAHEPSVESPEGTKAPRAEAGSADLTRASVDDKLARYLLNPDHPVGGPKAKWFEKALGFTRSNAGDLAKQIVFDPSRAVTTAVTEHGTKLNQVIRIQGANGRAIDVTFAWIRNKDGVVRLVTAIPAK